ncbi:MAG: hypothetical protein HY936_10825 [Nitrosomonadales bacterium]|nr:hypothetical protein [Nitrosomonadales bacterium]
MNERAIKRLLFIILASIVAIFLFKAVLTKTVVGLNKATADKKQATVAKSPAPQQAPAPPADAGAIIEAPATSSVDAVTTLDLPVSSIENEKR